MNARLPYWLAFFFLLATCYGGWKWVQVRQHQMTYSAEEPDLPPLEGFELTQSTGETFCSEDMRGKVWATTFFFSTCPGTCSKLNANIKRMTSLEDIADVTWVSISVDPVTDTLPVLEAYSENFGADPQQWRFVRGEMDYLRRVGQDILKLPVLYKDHNDYAAVIDKHGKIRGHYNALSSRECDKMHQKLLELLAEPGPAPNTVDVDQVMKVETEVQTEAEEDVEVEYVEGREVESQHEEKLQ